MMNKRFRWSKRVYGIRDHLSYAVISGLATIMLICGLATAIISMAVINPLLPGNAFFPLQAACEEISALAYLPGAGRASYFLSLADKRADDLEARAGTQYELAALTALDTALERTGKELENSTGVQAPQFWGRFLDLLQRSDRILARLTEISGPNVMAILAFQSRVRNLREMGVGRSRLGRGESSMSGAHNGGKGDTASSLIATGQNYLPGGLIPFPPGSLGAIHSFYGLTGRHTILECSTCHSQGRYGGINNACEGCHAAIKPANHFDGDCASCHSPIGWQEVNFNHTVAGATDCQSCHIADAPVNHYDGQCSNCHTQVSWQGVVFNHQNYTDCLACHAVDMPADHFSGQCSQCHTITGWRGATFNHNGYSDCQRCHSMDTPTNHFSGQCSQCHATTGWRGAVFNHSGYTDCQRCHAERAPNNHFAGQCSQCHNTSTWRGASFNHAGYTDCLACHAADAPGNHFGGQCSQCHSQNGWQGATFNHSGQSDCIACHSNDRPDEHDSGQCSACHDTNKWDD